METEKKKSRGWSKNNSINGRHRKDERRTAALARKAISDKLTPQQKLAKLDKMGAEAARERARLNALIEKAKSLAEISPEKVAEKVAKKKERTEKAALQHAAQMQGKKE